MATQNLQAVKVVGSLNGAIPSAVELPVTTSQSFKAGQLVYLTSGALSVVATAGQVIFGIALEDANASADGSETYLTRVQPIVPGMILEMNVNGSSGTVTTAVTQVGENYGIYTTGNKSYVNLDEISTIALRVIGRNKSDAVGDTYGRVFVTVISTYCQTDIAG